MSHVILQVIRHVLVTASCCIALTGCFRTKCTPDQVRTTLSELERTRASLSVADSVLRTVQLPPGCQLHVGSFERERRQIGAIVVDAKRAWFTQWNIQVTVRFDSTDHVDGVDAQYSAESAF